MLIISINYTPWHRTPPFYSQSKRISAALCVFLLIVYAELTLAEEVSPLQEVTTDTQPEDQPASIETESNEEQPAQETTTEPQDQRLSTETESEEGKQTGQESNAENQSQLDPAATDTEAESAKRVDPEIACDRTQDLLEKEATWYDSTHAVMNTAFCEPAVWFDDFFASDRIFEEVAGTYVRWRNDFIYNQEEGFRFDTNLNFSIELPRISSKLKLIFEGDQDQALQDILPDDQSDSASNTLGLRLDVKDTDRSKFNISVSAKPRIRLRYRYTYPVRDDFLIRFTQEVQNEKGVNGARSRLDFEKAFLPLRFFRATTDVFVAEDFPGADWAQAFSLFKRMSKKSSIAYEASVVGITRPENLVTSYRLGVRFRQSIHRDWLFLEVSPDITWPIDLSEDRETIIKDRRSVYSFLVRLEVHFGNAKSRKYSDFF